MLLTDVTKELDILADRDKCVPRDITIYEVKAGPEFRNISNNRRQR